MIKYTRRVNDMIRDGLVTTDENGDLHPTKRGSYYASLLPESPPELPFRKERDEILASNISIVEKTKRLRDLNTRMRDELRRVTTDG